MASIPPARRSPRLAYILGLVLVAAATFGVMWLWQNISDRKEEAKQTVFRVVEVTPDTINPAVWGKNYPRQFDSYSRTVDVDRTRHGGSDAFNKLEEEPLWKVIFNGYPFGVDYREERGHAYMLTDQDTTERVARFKQPGACLHCHSSILAAYREQGVKMGVPREEARRQEAIMKGFEEVCAMPLADARKMVEHPVSCIDCHNADSMALEVRRPAFLNGLQVLAETADSLPHMPSIERWRKGDRQQPYNPNTMASRQEMRSLVCAQCHVEYYFQGDRKLLVYPWHKGLKAEQIEAYFDDVKHRDWVHGVSGAPVLKAQHPEFELWSQGIHARSGVSCSDCHMPYQREGAIKVSDHHVRSPLLNVARACQTCHHFEEKEILARAEMIQDRTKKLMLRSKESLVELIETIAKAKQAGASDEALAKARDLQRKAQWRLDFIAAENSMGFHAPQESARILAEAIDYARQGTLAAERAMPAAGHR